MNCSDYNVEGREVVMEELAAWLKVNAPQSDYKNMTSNYVPNKIRSSMILEKSKAFKQRTRINVKWRSDLSNRLRITEDDTLKATNTIIEMMERELSNGGTVRISDFGDLKLVNYTYADIIEYEDGSEEESEAYKIKSARFFCSEDWKRELNAPLYDSELGLKYNFSVTKKKLTRRDV